MIEADPRELGERNGEDGEVHAGNAEAESQKADNGAARRTNRYGDEKSEPWSDAIAGEQHGRDIAADPGIDRMAERELPGKAHHDVPGLPGIGGIEDDDEDGQQIVIDEPRGDQQSRQQGAKKNQVPRR